MSSESRAACLALRLEGPLQSWGYEDRFNRRKTGLLPTKSGLIGLCCAALGAARGSAEEAHWLPRLVGLRRWLMVAVPRRVDERTLEVRRMEDYHTVQQTRSADGKIKDTAVLTQRTYLNDAAFAAFLTGDAAILEELAPALQDPRWGVWLGRKACIPSAPLVFGLYETEQSALDVFLGGESLSGFLRRSEVDDFSEGNDTLLDNPLNFADPRRFSSRRVKLRQPGEPD